MVAFKNVASGLGDAAAWLRRRLPTFVKAVCAPLLAVRLALAAAGCASLVVAPLITLSAVAAPQVAHATPARVAGCWFITYNSSGSCNGTAGGGSDASAVCQTWSAIYHSVGAPNYYYDGQGHAHALCYTSYFPGHWVDAYFSCPSGYSQTLDGCRTITQPICPTCRQADTPVAGDPIDLATGDLTESAVDFETAGGHPFRFARQYSFQNPLSGVQATSTKTPSGSATSASFGFNWSSVIDRQVIDLIGVYDLVSLEGGRSLKFVSLAPTSGGRRDKLTHPTSTTFTWTSAEGEVDHFTQVVSGGPFVITSIVEVGGHTLTFNYNASGLLQTIVDDKGLTATVTWTGGQVTHIAFPDGVGIDYAYTAATTSGGLAVMNLTSVTRTQSSVSRVITYHYEDTVLPTALTGITDERGIRYATWTYDDTDGRVTNSTLSGGADSTTVAYNDTAMTRTVTNALGKQQVYTFSTVNGTLLLTQLAGTASTHTPASTLTQTYNSSGFPTGSTDENGNVTHFTYTSGFETSRTEAFGTSQARTINTTWNTNLAVPTQIAEPTRTTDYTYDTDGNVTSKTVTDQTSFTSPYSTHGRTQAWSYAYTSGLLHTVTNPITGVTTFAYDISGFLTSVTDPVSNVTQVTARNGRGKPTTIVDQNGVTTTLTYDIDDRPLVMTVNPGGTQSQYQFTYTDAGDVHQITLPGGGYLQYTYDNARRATLVTNDRGETQGFTYDANGDRLTSQTKNSSSTLTQQQSATYDELGRTLQAIGAGSQTWAFAYDKLDNLVQTTDARSKVYGATFDPLNRVIVATDPESHTIQLGYDSADNLNDHKDGRALDTTRTVDGFGRTIKEVSPDRGTRTLWYDAADHVTKIVDGDSVEVDFTYDVAGRLLTSSYPGHSAETVTYAYDATASGNKGVGRLTGVTEESGSTGLTYDEQGRVVADAKTIQTKSYAVGYAYDVNGKVTGMTLPSGRTVTYTRASDGLVSGITTKATPTSSVETLASSAAYLPFGPLQSLTYGNGLSLTRTYDQNYWLAQTQVTATGVTRLDLSFGRNADGQLTGVTDNASSGRGASFGYTDAGRLNAATGPWGADAFTYDAAGNRTDKARTIAGVTVHETPTLALASNQVTQVKDGSGTVKRSLTWRTGGDLSQDAVTSGATYNFGYNARKRLVSAGAVSGDAGTYGYDYQGHRVWRTVVGASATVQTHYVFDQAGHLIAEHDGSTGAVLREYVWLDDAPVAMIDATGTSPATYFIHTGQIEEPLVMTDASKAKVWDAYVEPFGMAQVFGTPSAGLDLRLPGQFTEAETGGLNQNWNRNYDTSLGQYIEADPLGIDAGQNVYGYVNGDPLGYVDEQGLQYITDRRMADILRNHGYLSPRTREGNSKFNAFFSDPFKLRVVAESICNPGHGIPRGKNVEMFIAILTKTYTDTGVTRPVYYGIDRGGRETNFVTILSNRETGEILKMYPGIPPGFVPPTVPAK
jgi:RHS repeat-associated protein